MSLSAAAHFALRTHRAQQGGHRFSCENKESERRRIDVNEMQTFNLHVEYHNTLRTQYRKILDILGRLNVGFVSHKKIWCNRKGQNEADCKNSGSVIKHNVLRMHLVSKKRAYPKPEAYATTAPGTDAESPERSAAKRQGMPCLCMRKWPGPV